MYSYLSLLETVLKHGVKTSSRPGIDVYKVIGAQIKIDLDNKNKKTGKRYFPLLTTKKVSFNNIFYELMFFINGFTDQKWLENKNCRIWKPWSTKEYLKDKNLSENDLGPIYGFQWRHWNAPYIDAWYDYKGLGIDQLKNLLETLKTNPDSRRMICLAWNPEQLNEMALPPCHMMFQVSTINNDLYLHMYQRSADIFIGVPYNIASYALLTRLIAHATNTNPKQLIISFNDLHLYENHVEQARLQLERAPLELPTLEFKDLPSNNGIETLLSVSRSNIELEGYTSHPFIPAEVAV